MKKTFRKLLAAAGVMLLPAMAQTSLASHFQGSEITYICVAPGVYQVNCKIYRDCTGADAPTSIPLVLKSTGCNAGRTITVQASGLPRIGDPPCPQLPKTCSTTGRENYMEVVFSTTITFTAAEMACPDWIISTLNNARPSIVNLQNSQNNLYSEAYINLTSGVNNSSPLFGSLVVPYINAGKPIVLSSYAIDSDGDSLVYSLKPALSNPGAPYAYATYQSETIYNSDSTKSVLVPGGTYSPTYPIHSYVVDWSKPMPLTAVKSFVFDSNTGGMAFTPTRYRPNSAASLGENKYAVVVQVDEFRKVNGVVTKIGSVTRDMLITLSDCGPNSNPTLTSPVANGQPISPTDIINLRPGTPLTFEFAGADLNANDVLSITSDAGSVLPGAVFTQTSANKPTGTITWTPTAADVRSQIYYIHITTLDNSCPVKGSQTQTFGLRVSNTGAVTGLDKEVSNSGFIAYPNPFSQEVSFKLNLKNVGQTIMIYNALGQEVDRITLAGKSMGEQSIRWEKASRFASGSYVAKLVNQGTTVQTIKFSKMQ